MKRKLVLLCLSLTLLLVGCVQEQQESTAESTASVPQKEILHVAYLETDPASAAIVEAFASDTVAVVPVVLSTAVGLDDYLQYNNFPADVYLIPNTVQINIAGFALDHNVADLSELLPEIIGEIECYPVLDAGHIGGIQAFLPLRFQMPYMLTTQSQLAETGIDLPEKYTMAEFMEAFCRYAASCEEGNAAVYWAQRDGNIGAALYDALRMSGMWNADPSSLEQVVPESVLQAYAQYIKTVWGQTERAQGLYRKDISDWYGINPINATKKITFVRSEGFVPEALTVYNAACENNIRDSAVLLGCPQYEISGALTADVTLFAAISVHTEKREEICEFLRYALTTPEGQGIFGGFSVSRDAAQTCLEDMCGQSEKIYAAGGLWQKVPPMTGELRRECEALLDRIASGSIRNAYWERVFSGAMTDFEDESASFDSCLEKLRQRLYAVPMEAGLDVAELSLSDAVKQEILAEEQYRYRNTVFYQFPWSDTNSGDLFPDSKLYFGTFNGGILFRNGHSLLQTEGRHLYGLVYVSSTDTDCYYRYGVFFDPWEAYKFGLLTDEDVPVFSERFSQCKQAG